VSAKVFWGKYVNVTSRKELPWEQRWFLTLTGRMLMFGPNLSPIPTDVNLYKFQTRIV